MYEGKVCLYIIQLSFKCLEYLIFDQTNKKNKNDGKSFQEHLHKQYLC